MALQKKSGLPVLTYPAISVYKDMSPDEITLLPKIAQTTPVLDLPELIGALAQAQAIANMRLLAPAPTPKSESLQLVDRREAARIRGVSRYFLEGRRLPCEQRAGRKILYPKQTLEGYIRRGHVPYEGVVRDLKIEGGSQP